MSYAASPVQLLQSLLQHGPDRNAPMCSLAEFQRSGKKYNDRSGALSSGQLWAHIRGRQTYATPAAANGLGSWLPIDQDSDAGEAIPLLLAEARRRGLSAIGIIQPDNKGYIHLRTSELVNVKRLQLLGDELIRAVARPEWEKQPDNRAGNSDTRLPLGRHTHNLKHGTLLLQSGEMVDIDPDPEAAWSLLCKVWQPIDPATLPEAPAAPARTAKGTPSTGSLIARFNAEHDVETLLKKYGASQRRGTGKGLYVCPFHPDNNPSLKVYEDQHGRMACRCYSSNSGCPLSERGHYDAFNVYCIGEGTNSTPLPPLEALQRRYPECFVTTQHKQTHQAKSTHRAAVDTAAPPLSWDGIAKHTARTQTATGAWHTDKELRAYLQEHGSKGVAVVHLAREKLGEDATHAAINAEVARRIGKPYTDRHIRRLNSERRKLIADWEASKVTQGGDILSHPDVLNVLSNIYACEGGIPAEPAIELHADDLQQDLPIETPPITDVAPLVTVKGKRASKLPKTPTIADIAAFETARDKARKFMRRQKHFGIDSQANAVRKRVIEYERILAELYAQRDALQPSLLEHHAPEPDLPPSQARSDSGLLSVFEEIPRPKQSPMVPLPTAERGGGERSVSGVAAASAAGMCAGVRPMGIRAAGRDISEPFRLRREIVALDPGQSLQALQRLNVDQLRMMRDDLQHAQGATNHETI